MRGDIAEMEHMLDEYLDFRARRRRRGIRSRRSGRAGARRRRGGGAGARQARDRLAVDGAGQVIRSASSATALRRCLTNLIDNALKHGSHVAVTLKRDERMVGDRGRDDGPGIPEERREEAFRPFHRLDEGRNLQTGGTGLGLAIARDIARAHGGDIMLGNSAMGGLRATIRLPV